MNLGRRCVIHKVQSSRLRNRSHVVVFICIVMFYIFSREKEFHIVVVF